MKHAKDIKLQQGKTYTIEIPEEHTCTITLPYDRTYLVLQEQKQTNTGKLSKDDDDDDYTYTMKPVKVLNFPDRSSVCSHKDHTDGMGHTEKEENDNAIKPTKEQSVFIYFMAVGMAVVDLMIFFKLLPDPFPAYADKIGQIWLNILGFSFSGLILLGLIGGIILLIASLML